MLVHELRAVISPPTSEVQLKLGLISSDENRLIPLIGALNREPCGVPGVWSASRKLALDRNAGKASIWLRVGRAFVVPPGALFSQKPLQAKWITFPFARYSPGRLGFSDYPGSAR